MREFIRAGIAGIHIEDQLYPKRAHYHKYVVYAIPAKEFVDKIRMACRQRNETDKGFVVIARSDTARFRGPAYPVLPQGALLRAVNRAGRVRIRPHLPSRGFRGEGVCPEGRPTAFGFSGGGGGTEYSIRMAAQVKWGPRENAKNNM